VSDRKDSDAQATPRPWLVEALPWLIPSLIGVNVGLTFFYGTVVIAATQPGSPVVAVTEGTFRQLQAYRQNLLSNAGIIVGLNCGAVLVSLAITIVAISPWRPKHSVSDAWFAIVFLLIGILAGVAGVLIVLR
jgi:hypothetical protein